MVSWLQAPVRGETFLCRFSFLVCFAETEREIPLELTHPFILCLQNQQIPCGLPHIPLSRSCWMAAQPSLYPTPSPNTHTHTFFGVCVCFWFWAEHISRSEAFLNISDTWTPPPHHQICQSISERKQSEMMKDVSSNCAVQFHCCLFVSLQARHWWMICWKSEGRMEANTKQFLETDQQKH